MKLLIGIWILSTSLLSSAFAGHTVTFIVPCYNSEKWIKGAIESIYDQELFCPFEVVCVDDGSTDATYEILLSLTQQYSNLLTIHHPVPEGMGAACNSCVRNSSGDLIFRLDPQNLLEKNSVNKLIHFIDRTEFEVMSFGELRYFSCPFQETDRLLYHTKRGYYRLKDIFRSYNTPVWSGNYLYTRHSYDVVGGYPTEYKDLDAFAFAFLQLEKGFKIGYATDTYYWHRNEIGSSETLFPEKELLNVTFFKFLLEYEHLFSITSIWLMEKELRSFEKYGSVSQDFRRYFTDQKLHLR